MLVIQFMNGGRTVAVFHFLVTVLFLLVLGFLFSYDLFDGICAIAVVV